MKTQIKKLSVEEQLEKMLKRKTFDQLIKDGEILDIETARKKLGYSAWGLRRLCRKGKLEHIVLGDRYFFLASQVQGAFKVVHRAQP
jgi:hypothetical protein